MRASLISNSEFIENTFVGSLDTRLKLFICFLGSISTLIFNAPAALAVLLVSSLFYAYSASSLKVVIFTIVIASCLLALTLIFSWILSLFLPKELTSKGMLSFNFLSLATPYMRMIVVVMLLISLVFTSPIQRIMQSLYMVRLPGFLFIPLTVAIRFIPTFIEDCKQISTAVKLRPGRGAFSFIRGIFVPLIFRVLFSSDDLAMAAELKGVSPTASIPFKGTTYFSKNDKLTFLAAIFIIVLASLIQWL